MTDPVSAGDVATASGPSAGVRANAAPLPKPASLDLDVCPFLIAASGDWRLAAPTREHRCAAFVPLTSLSIEKQSRLCLRSTHDTCATYVASVAARTARTGSGIPVARAGRWGLARTAPLIEDTGGLRGTLITMIADRRTWPAIPAVLLVATLLAVGISGYRNEGQTAALATATATPGDTGPFASQQPAASATQGPADEVSPTPVSPNGSVGPTSGASAAATPTASYRVYAVATGDTLSSIATKFQVSISSLESLNNIGNPRSLHVGQKLKIPNA